MKRRGNRAVILYWDSGTGIYRDADILKSFLEERGYQVAFLPFRNASDKQERLVRFGLRCFHCLFPVTLQVHLQHVWREQFLLARHNLIFPNPEFFDPGILERLRRLDALCCKTRHADDLFARFSCPRCFTGFTSVDQFVSGIPKDYKRFLHLAGKSDWKGTDTVLQVWRRHPEWPRLEVIWSPVDSYGNPRRKLEGSSNIRILNERLSETELRELMNRCGVHLCPSLTEGFGHYIAEALSTGAFVVTTDAPPMNEMLNPEYGNLIEAEPVGHQFMSTLYGVRPEALEKSLVAIIESDTATLATKGEKARARYLERDRLFRERMSLLLQRFDSPT